MTVSEGVGAVGPSDSPARAEADGSILRSDEMAARLRQGMTRPTALGRYLLVGLGAVAVGSGAGLLLARNLDAALALLLCGGVLVTGGLLQYRSFQRSQSNWPAKLLLHEDGIELLLENGEIRAAGWSDPTLDLEIHSRPSRRGPGSEITLVWRMDRRIPPCPLSPEGFEQLRTEAEARGLKFQEFHRGRPGRELRMYLIGPEPPAMPSPEVASRL